MKNLHLVQDRYEKETDVMDGEYIVATFYDGVNGESTHQKNAELFAKWFQEKAELLDQVEALLRTVKKMSEGKPVRNLDEVILSAEKILEKVK